MHGASPGGISESLRRVPDDPRRLRPKAGCRAATIGSRGARESERSAQYPEGSLDLTGRLHESARHAAERRLRLARAKPSPELAEGLRRPGKLPLCFALVSFAGGLLRLG